MATASIGRRGGRKASGSTRTEARNHEGRSATRTVSEAILAELKGGPVASSELHGKIEKRFGVKSLFRARQELGSKVETGLYVEGEPGRFWEIAGK